MSYKEEIFARLERDGFESVSQIVDWLAGDKDKIYGKTVKNLKKARSRSSYTSFAQELAEPFELRDKIKKAETSEDLTEIKRDIDSLDISNAKKDLRDEYQSKLEIFKTEEKLAQKQEKEILETEKEISGIDEEITELNEEIEGFQAQKIAIETQGKVVGTRVETIEKYIGERELTIEERESARKRLQERIKEMTKKRGR